MSKKPPIKKESEKKPDKWEPWPPISSFPKKQRGDELEKRRYSTTLKNYCLSELSEPKMNISELCKHFNDTSKRGSIYYTYVLVDPRSHDGMELNFEAFIRGVFYIGEGCHGRCADHLFNEGLKGECQDCGYRFILEDMMIPKHTQSDCSSPKDPATIYCSTCQQFQKIEKGKFCHHKINEDCSAGKHEYIKLCHVCNKETAVYVRKRAGSTIGTIKPDHNKRCKGVRKRLQKGLCRICDETVAVRWNNLKSGPQRGDMKTHKKACLGSGQLPEKEKNEIKDKKIGSIWEADKIPTAVVCSQGDTKEHTRQKEAMMIEAYGTDNVSKIERRVDNYEQGKLVNKKVETVKKITNIEGSKYEEYGVHLLLKAWETYRSTDKPRCAARIMWPCNPKEAQPIASVDPKVDKLTTEMGATSLSSQSKSSPK